MELQVYHGCQQIRACALLLVKSVYSGGPNEFFSLRCDRLAASFALREENFFRRQKSVSERSRSPSGFPADFEFRRRMPSAFSAEFVSVNVPLSYDELRTRSLSLLRILSTYYVLIGSRQAKALFSGGKIGVQPIPLAAWFSGGF